MQLFSRNKALVALSLGALAALGACGDDVTVPAPVQPAVQVTISPSNASVNVGAFVDLAVQITGGTTTPTLATCSSSSAAVATTALQGTNACRVTGVSTGAVTITATTSAGQSAAASVTVNAPAPAITGISISPAAVNVAVGGTATIAANPTTTAPGATVTKAYVSSNPTVATVNATTGAVAALAPGQTTITVTLVGTGTGLTRAEVTGQAIVTVTANPPAITAVGTPNPSSALLVVGGTPVNGTITATAATGITPTWTAGSSNPGVATATITSAGAFTITAVGPGQATITLTASSTGNASFSAASATATVPVTVNAPAQVTVSNITQGQSNDPVNINSIQGQIQVQTTLATNNNVVRSVKLFVCPVGGSCPTTPAAEQTWGTAGAASGPINFFINTADFTVTSDWSDAAVRYTNGQKNIVAQIETQSATQANSNLAILNFDNSDAFAARHVAPARSAIGAGSSTPANNNLTWYGGPDAAGRGTVTVVPVIYTAGRTVARANVNITGSSCSNAPYTFVTGTDARPWSLEYGKYTSTPTAKQVACSGTSSTTPDLGVAVSNVIDNAQNNITVGTFATTTSSVPAVTAPAVIRGDYQGPAVTYALTAPANGGELGWVNAAYNFATATQTDGGVGPRAASTILYGFNGCGTTAFTAFTTNTGADIAECTTDFTGGLIAGTDTRGPYTARATGQDLLSNESTTATDNFGVDKTAPAIRYTAASDSNRTIYDSTAVAGIVAGTTADTLFQSEVLDERSGFSASAIQHRLARANQALNTGSCVVAPSSTAQGAAFITAPACTYSTLAFSGVTLGDGYRQSGAITLTGTLAAGQGYWSYNARVTDRAGNTSTMANRIVLVNTTSPVMTGMGLPSTITAAGPNVFTPNFTEVVESWFSTLRVIYGAGDTLVYPARLTYARFDDAIGGNGNTTLTTPFTSGVNFYTNLETVAADSSFVGSTVARPDSVAASVGNAAGMRSTFFHVGLLDPNVGTDAVAWATKAPLVSRFYLAPSAAGFNAPAGGVKAQAVASTNLINSPFSRIDFYRQLSAGTWEYAGSVDASATPCVSTTETCGVYIADNGATRVWTYVLRATGNSSSTLTGTLPLTGTYRAIASTGTAGRVISSGSLVY